MIKPLTVKQLSVHQGAVWVEFRQFTSANGWKEGLIEALFWTDRVFAGLTRSEYLVEWRCWERKPSLKERAFAPWEVKNAAD
jgi:hypothetical protein